MKLPKIFTFILFVAAVASAQVAPPAGSDTKITSKWGEPIGTVQWPAQYCAPGSVTTACIQGYTLTLTPPAGVGAAVVIPTCAAGTTATYPPCIPPTTGNTISYVWSPGGNLYCGTWGVSVAANWLDSSGNAISSAPLEVAVVEPCPFVASPATGLSATPTP